MLRSPVGLRRRSVVVLLLSGATLAFAAASHVWQEKNFKDWTDQDARSILMDSPWGKQIPMPVNGRPKITVIESGPEGAPPPTASLGNPSNTTTGTNMSTAGNPGSAGPADPNGTHDLPTARSSSMAALVGAPEPPILIGIVWASAKPVRLAVLKLRSAGATPSDSQAANVLKSDPYCVIAVVGLPAPDGDSDPKAWAKSASLRVPGKPTLAAFDSKYEKIGKSDVYFFRFLRASLPIDASDRQIEFKMRLQRINVQTKFELDQMTFQNALAL